MRHTKPGPVAGAVPFSREARHRTTGHIQAAWSTAAPALTGRVSLSGSDERRLEGRPLHVRPRPCDLQLERSRLSRALCATRHVPAGTVTTTPLLSAQTPGVWKGSPFLHPPPANRITSESFLLDCLSQGITLLSWIHPADKKRNVSIQLHCRSITGLLRGAFNHRD